MTPHFWLRVSVRYAFRLARFSTTALPSAEYGAGFYFGGLTLAVSIATCHASPSRTTTQP